MPQKPNDPTPTKTSNPKPKKCPSITIKQYRTTKRRLKNIEEDNHDRIIAIPVDGEAGWYEIAEHSALIYYYEVAEKLNLKANFFADDRSYYDQYELGYMRQKGLTHIRSNLKKLELLDYETESKTDRIHTFHLKLKYDNATLEKLKNRELARRLQNTSLVPASNLDPELYHTLGTLSTRLHKICSSRLDRLASQTNGRRIVILIDNLIMDYHRVTMMTHSPIEKTREILERMRRNIYELALEIKVLNDAKLWSLHTCADIGEEINFARKRIEIDLKKILRKIRSKNERTR